MKLLLIFLSFLISSQIMAAVQTFGIIGDAGHWNKHSKKVKNSLLESQVHNLILPGDNLYNTTLTYDQVWHHWNKFNFSVVAIGNHNRSYEEEMDYFALPHEFYSKIIGQSLFIVLNSDNESSASAQAIFLENELKQNKKPFVFVVYHHPPFSLKHSWEERRSFQLATRPILLKYTNKITAIIVGHDHIASLVLMDEIPVIISGAVFETHKIAPINTTENSMRVKTQWTSFGEDFYWTRMDVNEELGDVWINFVGAGKKQVDCSIKILPRPIRLKENCLKSQEKFESNKSGLRN